MGRVADVAGIVLDNSPSMSRLMRDGKTRFEHARAIAASAIEHLTTSDRAELLFTGRTAAGVFSDPPS